MNIFTLMGSIFVDSEKANESIAKTDEKAKGLAGSLGDGIKTAGKWALGIGAAAGAVGGAMLGMAMNSSDAAGEIKDMSQRAGTTAEEFQKLAYAAKLSGMESSTLEKAMIKQQKAFSDAKEGSKSMSEAYQRLGIDIDNIGSSGEAFDLVIKKLADMEDETTRNALANDIFGKSYADLTPLLMEGSDGIEALKNEAVELGGVLSNEAVDAGEQFGDTLDSVKTAFGGVITKLGIEFIPLMQKFLDWVLEHMPEIQGIISTVFGVISIVASNVYNIFDGYILPVLNILFNFIKENMPAIEKIVSIAFGSIWGIVNRVWKLFNGNLLPVLKTLYNFIEPTFPVIAKVVEIAFGAVIKTVESVISVFEKVTGAIRTAVDWLKSWNNTEAKEKKVDTTNDEKYDGSHDTGLAYVPFDGYIAELHKGERVLTKKENEKYLSGNNNGSGALITGNTFVVREEADIEKVARKLYDLQQKGKRGKGLI